MQRKNELFMVMVAMVVVAEFVGIVSWILMPETWVGHPATKTQGKLDTMVAGEMEPMIYSIIAVPWWALMCLITGTCVVYGFAGDMPTFPEKAIWVPTVGFTIIHFMSAILDYGAELATGGTEYLTAPIAYGALGAISLASLAARYFEPSRKTPAGQEEGI